MADLITVNRPLNERESLYHSTTLIYFKQDSIWSMLKVETKPVLNMTKVGDS